MPNRRHGPLPKKSARDKAIDRALLGAAKRLGGSSDGTIIVRLAEPKAPPATPASEGAKARANTTDPQTALALALKKAGLASEPHKVPAKAKIPETTPETPTGANAPQPAPKPPRGKAIPPKAPKRGISVPAQGKKSKRKKEGQAPDRKAPEPSRTGQPKQAPRLGDEAGRAARMRERMKDAARFIANIGQATTDELVELWRKNIAALEAGKSDFRALAMDYVEAIEGEWARRNIISRLDPGFFNWPSTKAAPGNGTFAALDHVEGILGYMGYHVGKTGESLATTRQTLLSRVFEGPLPPINGPDYMDEWDRSGSAARLEKMAVSIASAVKSAKRRREADFSVAIEHWEDDLDYLYRVYYVGRFRFDWPGSSGAGRF